jgi:hypothetical protein
MYENVNNYFVMYTKKISGGDGVGGVELGTFIKNVPAWQITGLPAR